MQDGTKRDIHEDDRGQHGRGDHKKSPAGDFTKFLEVKEEQKSTNHKRY